MNELERRAAEDAELVVLRAGLIADAREAAAIEARRIRREAQAFEIAHARMSRQRMSTKEQEIELRSIALELGAALHIHDRTMQRRLDEAASLVGRFAATVEALEQGLISLAHVRVIHDAGVVIEDPLKRAAWEQVVLRFAAVEAPARTASFARQCAEQMNPRSIDERFAEAHERRLVSVKELADGMAEIRAILPAAVAFGIGDRLRSIAKSIKTKDDELRRRHAEALSRGDIQKNSEEDAAAVAHFDRRTLTQTQADVLGVLALTPTPTIYTSDDGIDAIHANVQMTIPVSTITGVTSGGGELNGTCAVDDVTARRLAGNAPGWDRVFTDPVTGTVREVDRYHPLASQRRFLNARDVRCRTVGCNRSARGSQVDHNHERQHGGRTSLDNLCNLCVRHHTVKTETGWTVTQLPGGTLDWTSPLGFTYRDDPPKRVVFAPSDEPAPF